VTKDEKIAAVQYQRDLVAALNRAQATGVPFDLIASMTDDFAEDLCELADDSQWPDKLPKTMDEARAQMDGKDQKDG